MSKNNTFTFRVSEAERQMLSSLSERLSRTQSDTVRLLIREATRKLYDSSKEEIDLYRSDLAPKLNQGNVY